MKYVLGLLLLQNILTPVSGVCSSSDRNAEEILTVTETPTVLSTPGWRVTYYSQMDCRWMLDTGVAGVTIVIDVTQALIESSNNCRYDALNVYQGNSTSDTKVAGICGRLYYGQYVTVSGQYAVIQLTSDASRQYAGATLKYFYAQENAHGACSGTTPVLTASTSEQFLTSPGYPVSLDGGLDCTWRIDAAAGTVLKLEIANSDLLMSEDLCYDHVLSLYDGSSDADPVLLDQFCDMRSVFPTKATVYYTTGPNAFVKLTTLPFSGEGAHGFKLTYKQNQTAVVTTTTTTQATTTTILTDVCSAEGEWLSATATWSVFSSVNYPLDYYNNMDCYWVIEAASGYTVNMTITDSLLQESEGCWADHLTVYDGQSSRYPVLAAICGETATSVIQSTGRFLYIHLHSDASVTYRGFSAQYRADVLEVPSCLPANVTANYTATEEWQTMTSPGFPVYYENSTVLYWLLYNPNQTKTLVMSVEDSRLEGSVDCKYDSVAIYKGPCLTYPILGRFCGVDNPTYYFDTGTYVLIQMTTDSTVNFKGFQMTFYVADIEESTISVFVIAGIIAGSVIGAAAIAAGAAYGTKKYLKWKKKTKLHTDSPHSSRRSSSSSSSSDEALSSRQDGPLYDIPEHPPSRLPPLSDTVQANLY